MSAQIKIDARGARYDGELTMAEVKRLEAEERERKWQARQAKKAAKPKRKRGRPRKKVAQPKDPRRVRSPLERKALKKKLAAQRLQSEPVVAELSVEPFWIRFAEPGE